MSQIRKAQLANVTHSVKQKIAQNGKIPWLNGSQPNGVTNLRLLAFLAIEANTIGGITYKELVNIAVSEFNRCRVSILSTINSARNFEKLRIENGKVRFLQHPESV